MEELTLEPFAARLRWRFSEPTALPRWRTLLAAFLDGLGAACATQGVIGHIKGLALLPGGGFLRGSKVSAAYPADVELSNPTITACDELELSLNVLVYGLPLSAARSITHEVGQKISEQWGGELSSLETNPNHPADHRHHD